MQRRRCPKRIAAVTIISMELVRLLLSPALSQEAAVARPLCRCASAAAPPAPLRRVLPVLCTDCIFSLILLPLELVFYFLVDRLPPLQDARGRAPGLWGRSLRTLMRHTSDCNRQRIGNSKVLDESHRIDVLGNRLKGKCGTRYVLKGPERLDAPRRHKPSNAPDRP